MKCCSAPDGDAEDGVDPKAYPLERLALARNKLGDAEGRVLAVAIARNPQLRRVDAAWNGFTPATGALLLEAPPSFLLSSASQVFSIIDTDM